MEIKEYDFYTIEDNTHFKRERCTEEQAKAYANSFNLKYKQVN